MRCRALSGGTSLGRPAGDDNPQDRPRPGGKLSLSKKQIASFPILVSCLKKWLTHFLDELQRTLPTEVGIPGWGQGEEKACSCTGDLPRHIRPRRYGHHRLVV